MDTLNFPKLRMFEITGMYRIVSHTLVKGTAGYVSCVPYIIINIIVGGVVSYYFTL